MALVVLALKTVVIIMLAALDGLGARHLTLLLVLHLPRLLMFLLGHLLELIHDELEVLDQAVTSGTGEVFSNDNTHELELLAVRCHGVSWFTC